MSLRLLPATLRVMRGLVICAAVFAAVAAYSPITFRYHSFFAGSTLGLLLVLAALLFAAHPAEVEPGEPPGEITDHS